MPHQLMPMKMKLLQQFAPAPKQNQPMVLHALLKSKVTLLMVLISLTLKEPQSLPPLSAITTQISLLIPGALMPLLPEPPKKRPLLKTPKRPPRPLRRPPSNEHEHDHDQSAILL